MVRSNDEILVEKTELCKTSAPTISKSNQATGVLESLIECNIGAINNNKFNESTQIKVYKKRFLILFLYCIYAISSAAQWIEYAVISDVVAKYYSISYTAVNWSSLIFMLIYIPTSIPGTYYFDKLGLRNSVLLGMLGTCIGAWIKVGSVNPDRYWVLLLGQAFVAISQVFVLPVPPKLAMAWYGENEVSLACSIGIIATQVASAIGFLIPPLIVKVDEEEVVKYDLYVLSIVVASFATGWFALMYFFFQNAPPKPPSLAQLRIQQNLDKEKPFTKTLKVLLKNRSYVILIFVYAVNVGIYYAYNVMLSQIILSHYSDAAQDVGIIGLVMIIFGVFGSLICGIILDKFHRYKELTYIFHFSYLLSAIAFSIFVNWGLPAVYITLTLLGIFFNGILTIGFELGVELTYPEPEGVVGELLVPLSQLCGIIFTYLYSFLFTDLTEMWANIAICIALLVVDLFIFFIHFNLKRFAVQFDKQSKPNEI